MSDRTQFALGTRKVMMPRAVKRSIQVFAAALLTALVVLMVVLINTLLVGRGGAQGLDVWLAFIKRTDILGTIVLTALVTVSFVYWQRDRERR